MSLELAALIKSKPHLFEKINLADYSDNSLLDNLDEDLLLEDGKANWISIDDDQTDSLQTYRFYWADVLPHLILITQLLPLIGRPEKTY